MTNHNQVAKKTILVLDDDQMMLLFLQSYLGDEYVVEPFDAGQDALSWLSEGRAVDAILVDLKMPAMDGLSFVESVRSIEHVRTTPIVILSGSNRSSERLAGLQAGAVDFVGKPFNPDELRARLAIHLMPRSSAPVGESAVLGEPVSVN